MLPSTLHGELPERIAVFSSSLSWIFTVVFVLAGVYSLVRLAELHSGSDRSGSRIVELSHLLMSVAMIAMAWTWTGGPSTPSGIVQIVVFGLFTVWFLARLAMPAVGDHRTHDGYHLAMNAAMVWMVAAMPQIMGMSTGGAPSSDGGLAGMPGMGGMPGMDSGTMTPATPAWATVVSWVFIVLLVASAVLWAVHIARPDTVDDAIPAADERAGGDGSVAVAARSAPTRTTGPRLDAGCHLLKSLGMAGMLLAML